MPFKPKGSRFWHYDFQIGVVDFTAALARRLRGSQGGRGARRVEAKVAPDLRGIFTMAEAIGTCWADVSQHQTCSGVTLSQGKGLLGILDGKTRLDALTMADIARYVAARRASVANATVNRELQLLDRALRHMAKFHQVKVAGLDLRAAEVEEPRERIRELSPAEQMRLFKHLRPIFTRWCNSP